MNDPRSGGRSRGDDRFTELNIDAVLPGALTGWRELVAQSDESLGARNNAKIMLAGFATALLPLASLLGMMRVPAMSSTRRWVIWLIGHCAHGVPLMAMMCMPVMR